MKKLVLVNVDFKDVYTGQLHKAGDKVEMTDERIAEVKSVNPEMVSVIGLVEEPEEIPAEDSEKKLADGEEKPAEKTAKADKKAEKKSK